MANLVDLYRKINIRKIYKLMPMELTVLMPIGYGTVHNFNFYTVVLKEKKTVFKTVSEIANVTNKNKALIEQALKKGPYSNNLYSGAIDNVTYRSIENCQKAINNLYELLEHKHLHKLKRRQKRKMEAPKPYTKENKWHDRANQSKNDKMALIEKYKKKQGDINESSGTFITENYRRTLQFSNSSSWR